MTIRDRARGGAARAIAAGGIVVALAAAGLFGCGQRGALRLPANASSGAVAPGNAAAASAPDARDPFSAPSPTAAPASVPRP